MTKAFCAVRTQCDDLGDKISNDTAQLETGEIITRQEFKDEADLNILLARFGVHQQVRADAKFTEVDYNLDLQTALAAVEAARRADYKVPEELRAKYPNWLTVLKGAETGEYEHDLMQLKARKEAEELAKKNVAPNP